MDQHDVPPWNIEDRGVSAAFLRRLTDTMLADPALAAEATADFKAFVGGKEQQLKADAVALTRLHLAFLSRKKDSHQEITHSGGGGGAHRVGDCVEVFSESKGKWMRGEIKRIHRDGGLKVEYGTRTRRVRPEDRDLGKYFRVVDTPSAVSRTPEILSTASGGGGGGDDERERIKRLRAQVSKKEHEVAKLRKDLATRTGGLQPYLTTRDVHKHLVVAETRGAMCRFLELDEMVEDGEVGKAACFLSHSWDSPWEDLVSALEAHTDRCRAASARPPFYWVDIFAVNQHLATPPWKCTSGLAECPGCAAVANDMHDWKTADPNHPKGFERVIQHTRHTLVLMEPWDNPRPPKRVWCLFEGYQTLARKGTLEVVLGWRRQRELQASLGDRFEELEKIVSSIDAREAEATVELDHDNIFAAIKLLPDGFDGLNKEMRLAQQKWLADAAEGVLERTDPDRPPLDEAGLELEEAEIGPAGARMTALLEDQPWIAEAVRQSTYAIWTVVLLLLWVAFFRPQALRQSGWLGLGALRCTIVYADRLHSWSWELSQSEVEMLALPLAYLGVRLLKWWELGIVLIAVYAVDLYTSMHVNLVESSPTWIRLQQCAAMFPVVLLGLMRDVPDTSLLLLVGHLSRALDWMLGMYDWMLGIGSLGSLHEISLLNWLITAVVSSIVVLAVPAARALFLAAISCMGPLCMGAILWIATELTAGPWCFVAVELAIVATRLKALSNHMAVHQAERYLRQPPDQSPLGALAAWIAKLFRSAVVSIPRGVNARALLGCAVGFAAMWHCGPLLILKFALQLCLGLVALFVIMCAALGKLVHPSWLYLVPVVFADNFYRDFIDLSWTRGRAAKGLARASLCAKVASLRISLHQAKEIERVLSRVESELDQLRSAKNDDAVHSWLTAAQQIRAACKQGSTAIGPMQERALNDLMHRNELEQSASKTHDGMHYVLLRAGLALSCERDSDSDAQVIDYLHRALTKGTVASYTEFASQCTELPGWDTFLDRMAVAAANSEDKERWISISTSMIEGTQAELRELSTDDLDKLFLSVNKPAGLEDPEVNKRGLVLQSYFDHPAFSFEPEIQSESEELELGPEPEPELELQPEEVPLLWLERSKERLRKAQEETLMSIAEETSSELISRMEKQRVRNSLMQRQHEEQKQRAITDLLLAAVFPVEGRFWNAIVGLWCGVFFSVSGEEFRSGEQLISMILNHQMSCIFFVPLLQWCRPDRKPPEAGTWTQYDFEFLCTLALLSDCIGYSVVIAPFVESWVSKSWMEAKPEDVRDRFQGTMVASIVFERFLCHLLFSVRPHRWLVQTEPRPFERMTAALFFQNLPHSDAWLWRIVIPAVALSAGLVSHHNPGNENGVLFPVREGIKISLIFMVFEALFLKWEMFLLDRLDLSRKEDEKDVVIFTDSCRSGVQIAVQLAFMLALLCDLAGHSRSFEHLNNNFPGGQHWHFWDPDSASEFLLSFGGEDPATEDEQQTTEPVHEVFVPHQDSQSTDLESDGTDDKSSVLRFHFDLHGEYGFCADEDKLAARLADCWAYADDRVAFLFLVVALCCRYWWIYHHLGKRLQKSAQKLAWQLLDACRNDPFVKCNPYKATAQGLYHFMDPSFTGCIFLIFLLSYCILTWLWSRRPWALSRGVLFLLPKRTILVTQLLLLICAPFTTGVLSIYAVRDYQTWEMSDWVVHAMELGWLLWCISNLRGEVKDCEPETGSDDEVGDESQVQAAQAVKHEEAVGYLEHVATTPAELELYWTKLEELKKHKSFAESYIETLAKFKPNPPNPEQQKVVDNVRNYLKMFLILCEETWENYEPRPHPLKTLQGCEKTLAAVLKRAQQESTRG